MDGGCIEEEKQVRHRSLVSAISSQRRQSDKRKKRQREVQRGKLFACESKTFPTTAAVTAIEKEEGEGQGATF